MPLIQPSEREQEPGKPARRVGEVLLDRTAGARGDIGRDETEHEQDDGSGQADAVDGTADPFGDGWLDDLDAGQAVAPVAPASAAASTTGSAAVASRSSWSCTCSAVRRMVSPVVSPMPRQVGRRPRPWGLRPLRVAGHGPILPEAGPVRGRVAVGGACAPGRLTSGSGARLTP